MTVTLVTACYNSAAVIRTAMESVLRQTWPEIEYIVVDGGSADGTVDVIREFEPKFGGRMRWVSEKDRGMYDAINKGIRIATGEVVGILNADDVLVSDAIIARVAEAFGKSSKVLKCESSKVERSEIGGYRLEADDREGTNHFRTLALPNVSTSLDAVYGDIRFVANKKTIVLDELRQEKTIRYYSSRHFRPWLARFGYLPAHPSFYCRKALFEKLGGYLTDYKIAADHELMIRYLVKEKIGYQYVPEVFVVMRVGGMSTRSLESTVILNRENIRACRANGIYTNRLMQVGKYLFKVPGLVFRDGY